MAALLHLVSWMSCLVLEHIVPRLEYTLAVIYIYVCVYFLLDISILPNLLNLNCFAQVWSSRFFFQVVGK